MIARWFSGVSTLALLLVSPQAMAQLTGQVTSAEEGAMEGVVVSAKKDGSNITTSVITNAQGRYSIPAARVEPGQYSIDIRATGFELDFLKFALSVDGRATRICAGASGQALTARAGQWRGREARAPDQWAASAALTARSRCSRISGFCRKSSAPRSSAERTRISSSNPLIMITPSVGSSRRIRPSTTRPFISGRPTSRRTRSGLWPRMLARAPSPSAASAMVYP